MENIRKYIKKQALENDFEKVSTKVYDDQEVTLFTSGNISVGICSSLCQVTIEDGNFTVEGRYWNDVELLSKFK